MEFGLGLDGILKLRVGISLLGVKVRVTVRVWGNSKGKENIVVHHFKFRTKLLVLLQETSIKLLCTI